MSFLSHIGKRASRFQFDVLVHDLDDFYFDDGTPSPVPRCGDQPPSPRPSQGRKPEFYCSLERGKKRFRTKSVRPIGEKKSCRWFQVLSFACTLYQRPQDLMFSKKLFTFRVKSNDREKKFGLSFRTVNIAKNVDLGVFASKGVRSVMLLIPLQGKYPRNGPTSSEPELRVTIRCRWLNDVGRDKDGYSHCSSADPNDGWFPSNVSMSQTSDSTRSSFQSAVSYSMSSVNSTMSGYQFGGVSTMQLPYLADYDLEEQKSLGLSPPPLGATPPPFSHHPNHPNSSHHNQPHQEHLEMDSNAKAGLDPHPVKMVSTGSGSGGDAFVVHDTGGDSSSVKGTHSCHSQGDEPHKQGDEPIEWRMWEEEEDGGFVNNPRNSEHTPATHDEKQEDRDEESRWAKRYTMAKKAGRRGSRPLHPYFSPVPPTVHEGVEARSPPGSHHRRVGSSSPTSTPSSSSTLAHTTIAKQLHVTSSQSEKKEQVEVTSRQASSESNDDDSASRAVEKGRSVVGKDEIEKRKSSSAPGVTGASQLPESSSNYEEEEKATDVASTSNPSNTGLMGLLALTKKKSDLPVSHNEEKGCDAPPLPSLASLTLASGSNSKSTTKPSGFWSDGMSSSSMSVREMVRGPSTASLSSSSLEKEKRRTDSAHTESKSTGPPPPDPSPQQKQRGPVTPYDEIVVVDSVHLQPSDSSSSTESSSEAIASVSSHRPSQSNHGAHSSWPLPQRSVSDPQPGIGAPHPSQHSVDGVSPSVSSSDPSGKRGSTSGPVPPMLRAHTARAGLEDSHGSSHDHINNNGHMSLSPLVNGASVVPHESALARSTSSTLRFVKFEDLRDVEQISEGYYGWAYRGKWYGRGSEGIGSKKGSATGRPRDVVVKVPKHSPGRDEWNELFMFLDLPAHPNVLPLVGICKDFPNLPYKAFCFVTQFQKASLLDYLSSVEGHDWFSVGDDTLSPTMRLLSHSSLSSPWSPTQMSSVVGSSFSLDTALESLRQMCSSSPPPLSSSSVSPGIPHHFDSDKGAVPRTSESIDELRKAVSLCKLVSRLLLIAVHMAKGVAHLHTHGIVHRDIALRNFLVSRENRVLICDFGLSRDVNPESGAYVALDSHNAMPVRWMSPESLLAQKSTVQSDVWMFGVALWELFSGGSAIPYSEVSVVNRLVVGICGGTLKLKANPLYPLVVTSLIDLCCSTKPSDRPSIERVAECLELVAHCIDRTVISLYERMDHASLSS